jgi:hypothetical protein
MDANGKVLRLNCAMLMMLCGLVCGTSCTSMKAEVQREEIAEVDASMELPEQNITIYDDALRRFGLMLAAYNVPPQKLQCRSIVNATASSKVPSDVSQLALSAISKIGPQIQSIDFDKEQLAVDLAVEARTMERLAPDLALKGAITEYDKKVEKERELEADAYITDDGNAYDAGGSLDSDAESVTVAMDFQVLDYRTQTLIPFVQAANRINLYAATKGFDLGLAFEGSGFGFNCKVKKAQGVHAGLRLLVELSVLEVLGKYSNIPYWRCVEGGKPDVGMIDRYTRNLKNDPDIVFKMKSLAYAYGRDMDLLSNGVTEDELRDLRTLKVELGLDPAGENDYEFMKRMWLNLPYERAADRMLAVKEDLARREQAMLEAQQEALRAAQLQAQAEAREAAQAAQAEAASKRTTFKFGRQDAF